MKNIYLLLTILFTCTLLSCQDDTDDTGLPIHENGFRLLYTIPELETLTRSEVTAVESEDRINTFYALFFEYTTGGSGQFLAAIDLMEGRQTPLSTSAVLNIDYSTVPGLSASETYTILLCANLEAYHATIRDLTGLETVCRGATEAEVKSLLRAETLDAITTTNLPMSASVVKQGGQNQVSVSLTRAASRFDVVNQADGYKLVSASLWNTYPSTLLWENNGEDFSGSRTERYYSIDATGDQIIGGLYSFENFVENPAQGDNQTTALIIEMKNLETEDSEFFRINVHPMNESQHLKRNNIYRTAITQVSGKGFQTEREAWESQDALLITDINSWMADPGNNVVFDENNILAVPTSVITLPMVGDTRTYNIFTDGEGTLEMATKEIPSQVKVKLEGNKLTIEAPEAADEWGGTLTFSIGNLMASIQIQQANYINKYLTLNYDVEELPLFDYPAGIASPEIEIISSGTWVAEIFGGEYFSFSSSGSRVDKISNDATHTGFTIYTIEENMSEKNRYCFVRVSLMDAPETNQVLVLEQARYEEYIRLVKADNKSLNASAHTYEGVTLESNADWTITIPLDTGGAEPVITFLDDNNNLVTNNRGNGTKKLRITVKSNLESDRTRPFVIMAKTTAGKETSLLLTQRAGTGNTPEPDPVKPLQFISNGTGHGNLTASNSSGYLQAVYGLGENMRNSAKFGKGGSIVNLETLPYEYSSSMNESTINNAKIIQLLSNPSASEFDLIYKRMQADPTVFLMITSSDATEVTKILAQYKAKSGKAYGTAVQLSNISTRLRPVNARINNSLMNYLLTGISANQVSLQGAIQTSAGLPPAAYPSTFVPVIMSTSDYYYCVFGIDPVNRLIIMIDSGVFGAAPRFTNYPSYKNFQYTGTTNYKFLDNLTAWIMRATGESGFLKNTNNKGILINHIKPFRWLRWPFAGADLNPCLLTAP
ncbi:MAG: hypothetical protein LUH15_00580 [Tannerellaceae bacterium]|nr:hypothetical protein [Tannerellaceae bacterium]